MDVEGEWSVSSPESIPGFSAVAYYFGRDVHQMTEVPVGLIHTSWGGTPSDAWTSRFKWAEAEIEGEDVVVWNEVVKKPVAVRYGWANNPVCNLYNKAGFPASPFRTDDWAGITVGKN